MRRPVRARTGHVKQVLLRGSAAWHGSKRRSAGCCCCCCCCPVLLLLPRAAAAAAALCCDQKRVCGKSGCGN